MKNKKTWILVAAVLLVLAVLVIVIDRQNHAAPAETETPNVESAESAAAPETTAQSETPAESETGAETPAESENPEEAGEEGGDVVVTIPDGMEIGGEGLD